MYIYIYRCLSTWNLNPELFNEEVSPLVIFDLSTPFFFSIFLKAAMPGPITPRSARGAGQFPRVFFSNLDSVFVVFFHVEKAQIETCIEMLRCSRFHIVWLLRYSFMLCQLLILSWHFQVKKTTAEVVDPEKTCTQKLLARSRFHVLLFFDCRIFVLNISGLSKMVI